MAVGRGQSVRRAKEITERLHNQDVDGVVLSYVETAGINRIKAIPLRRPAAAEAEWP